VFIYNISIGEFTSMSPEMYQPHSTWQETFVDFERTWWR